MSPEISSALSKKTKAIYTKAVDVYSLGVLFRDNLLFGKLDSPLHDLVNSMTVVDPKARPSIQEVIETMKSFSNRYEFKKDSDFAEGFSLSKVNYYS